MQSKTKSFTKALSLVLCVAMLLATAVFAGAAETADLSIGNAQELADFAAAVDGGETYAGKTVVLTADISLPEGNWNPIGDEAAAVNIFAGTFDGQGHKISGLTISNNYGTFSSE